MLLLILLLFQLIIMLFLLFYASLGLILMLLLLNRMLYCLGRALDKLFYTLIFILLLYLNRFNTENGQLPVLFLLSEFGIIIHLHL